MTFTVSDTKNGSSSFSPDIYLCGCGNNGTCFIDTNDTETDNFVDMECECVLGKTGRYCEDQRDFCITDAGLVCHPLVTCYNHPTNYTCGPCPTGYNGTGDTCIGKARTIFPRKCYTLGVCTGFLEIQTPDSIRWCVSVTRIMHLIPAL